MAARTVTTPSDDRRLRLEELRDWLHAAMKVAEPNMLPQLAGQYRATLADLAALPVVAEKVPVKDDLKGRRALRIAEAKASTPARGA